MRYFAVVSRDLVLGCVAAGNAEEALRRAADGPFARDARGPLRAVPVGLRQVVALVREAHRTRRRPFLRTLRLLRARPER